MSNSFVMIPSEKVDQILKEIENLKSQLDNLKDPSKNGQGKSSDKLLSRHELSEKLNLGLSTVQKAVIKLRQNNVLEQSQKNLEKGGYFFTYRIKNKPILMKNAWMTAVPSTP